MSREMGKLARRLNEVSVERVDTCNEVHLGICSTICIALIVACVALPVFDVSGMGWISSWDGEQNLTWPTPAPTYLVDVNVIKEHLRETVPDATEVRAVEKAFAMMDSDADGRLTIAEVGSGAAFLGVPRAVAPSVFHTLDPADRGFVDVPSLDAVLKVSPEPPPEPAALLAAGSEWRHFQVVGQETFGSAMDSCQWLDSGASPPHCSMDDFVEVCSRSVEKSFEKNPFGLFLRDGGQCTRERLQLLFDQLDQDRDGIVSQKDCELDLRWYVDRLLELLRPLGAVTELLAAEDGDKDGKLSAAEFGALTKPLSSGLFFAAADANEDGFVSRAELENLEACGDAATCNGYEEVCQVTEPQLSRYENVPAIVSGSVSVYFKVPNNLKQATISGAKEIALDFQMIFQEVFGIEINLHDAQAVAWNSAEDMDPLTSRRKVIFYIAANLKNGAQFHRSISDRNKIGQLNDKLKEVFDMLTWLDGMPTPSHWCKMDASYYGPLVRDGHLEPLMLQQHFGITPPEGESLVEHHYQCKPRKPGETCSEDGTPPFHLKVL